MADRHTTILHRIALLNGVLISAAVPKDGDIDAAIAAEAAKANIEFDRADVETPDVYLSDVKYDDILICHESGRGGHIGTADGVYEYRYAYDAADADDEAEKFLESEGTDLSRMLYNLEIETAFAGNISSDWSTPLRSRTLDTMDVLEMRRALGLRPEIVEIVDGYVDGCDAQPDIDDVLRELDDKNLLPEHEFWISDPFVVVVAALAVDVIADFDVSKETAEAALRERDEDLFIVGRDPARDHMLQIGREIENGRAYLSVDHVKDYRSVVAWAQDDQNFVEHDEHDEAA